MANTLYNSWTKASGVASQKTAGVEVTMNLKKVEQHLLVKYQSGNSADHLYDLLERK